MPGRHNNRRRSGRRGRGGRGIMNPRSSFNVNARQSMIFRLAQTVTLSSNGSGILAAIIYNDPTSGFANFTEHTSDLSNLFNEFRFIQTRVQFISTIETKGDTSVLVIGYQNRGTSTMATPSSGNQVADNQPSYLWAVSNDTSARGFTVKQRINGIAYNNTNSTSSPDYAGAPGGWQIYGAGFPNSTALLYYKQECWYQYRSRS